jgi:hypothetical protein
MEGTDTQALNSAAMARTMARGVWVCMEGISFLSKKITSGFVVTILKKLILFAHHIKMRFCVRTSDIASHFHVISDAYSSWAGCYSSMNE